MNIKCYNVSDDIVDKILYDFESKIVEVDELEDKSYYEYRNNIVYVKKTKEIICQEKILNYYTHYFKQVGWRQIKLTPTQNANIKVIDSVDGGRAWAYVLTLLKRFYTIDEIRKILEAYTDTETSADNQYHYYWPIVSQNVQKVPNCVKYDINGAHCYMLSKMFPKCSAIFYTVYKRRHSNIRYKEYVNYFVGMLQRKGYTNAYWHIVHETTRILMEAMNKVGGICVYANTDGFCVSNPEHELVTDDVLGHFKEEYRGDVYIYTNRRQTPYILYQFGDTPDAEHMKGSCMTVAREGMDLSKGIINHYKRLKHGNIYLAANMTKETLCVK